MCAADCYTPHPKRCHNTGSHKQLTARKSRRRQHRIHPVNSSDVRLGGTIITNPARPFWPDEGLTKLDLARFYARIAGQILPWMKGRPVTMERRPEGIHEIGRAHV